MKTYMGYKKHVAEQVISAVNEIVKDTLTYNFTEREIHCLDQKRRSVVIVGSMMGESYFVRGVVRAKRSGKWSWLINGQPSKNCIAIAGSLQGEGWCVVPIEKHAMLQGNYYSLNELSHVEDAEDGSVIVLNDGKRIPNSFPSYVHEHNWGLELKGNIIPKSEKTELYAEAYRRGISVPAVADPVGYIKEKLTPKGVA